MKTVKLTREEAETLCEVLRTYDGPKKEIVESARYKIFLEPDDTVMYMDIVERKEDEDEGSDDELGLESCEQCGEDAWDGYICHACGLKKI